MPPKADEPTSWASDLQSYRNTVGSRSYSSLDQTSTGRPPPRYVRTNMAPMGHLTHPMYQFDEYRDGPGIVVDPAHPDRMRRHGYGGTTMLHHNPTEEATSSQVGGRRVASADSAGGGRRRVSSPKAIDGRQGLFGVLQMTEAGRPDSWIGNVQVDPAKGKRAIDVPADRKGRKDLFDVLQARTPGMPADDSWLGHVQVDPARGKLRPPGPEERRGRTAGLTPIMQQQILKEENRLQLLAKGADPLGDAWCGHRQIDPARGKGIAGEGMTAAGAELQGATFRVPPGPDYTDMARRHSKMVDPPCPTTAQHLVNQTAKGDDWGQGGRRAASVPPPEMRQDLYAHMTYRPLSDAESAKCAKSWNDSGAVTGKSRLPTPGSQDAMKGPDMLAWRPDMRIATHVPYGGLAQNKQFLGTPTARQRRLT